MSPSVSGKMVANKRVLYDWTINPPKSVSLAALLQDSRIIAAHDRAVNATLRELETFAETRVRRDGPADGVRPTGNLVVACSPSQRQSGANLPTNPIREISRSKRDPELVLL